MNLIIALVVIIILLSIVFIALYNGLVRKRVLSEEAWSGIDVQLKRRYNLVPNLIEVVKKYAAHEEKVFNDIATSRERCLSAGESIKDLSVAESGLASGLKSVFALAENYPELKSDSNFLEFQKELSSLEDQIQMARRYYNGATRDLNISIETFPSVIIANMFGFSKRDFFEIDEDQKNNPNVEF